jgi:RNA polymerase sigma-70 factor (ECF subfamily)
MQQVYVEAQGRIRHFVHNPSLTFYGWLRQVTLQTLVDFHRRHLGAQKRDAKQEISIHGARVPGIASQALAEQLAGSLTSPSQAAVRHETVDRLRQAIESMDEIDREVLVLRHFEELGNQDVARILEIGEAAASNRYIRALKRLKDMLARSSTS